MKLDKQREKILSVGNVGSCSLLGIKSRIRTRKKIEQLVDLGYNIDFLSARKANRLNGETNRLNRTDRQTGMEALNDAINEMLPCP